MEGTNMSLKPIDPKILELNPFTTIGTEWMLLTAGNEDKHNTMTVSWGGLGVLWRKNVTYVLVRPQRYTMEFMDREEYYSLCVFDETYKPALKLCGTKSGRDVDKFQELHLTKEKADHVKAPMIGESPVNIECKVKKIEKLGSHHMFLAEVVAVHADEAYMDKNNKFQLNQSKLMVYSHGEYLGLGKKLGTFGYSVKKGKKRAKTRNR